MDGPQRKKEERRGERGGALFYDPLSAKGFFAVVGRRDYIMGMKSAPLFEDGEFGCAGGCEIHNGPDARLNVSPVRCCMGRFSEWVPLSSPVSVVCPEKSIISHDTLNLKAQRESGQCGAFLHSLELVRFIIFPSPNLAKIYLQEEP